ncbi:hypothetical protein [Staphylococcus marylandisciuri]|uniref:hypothetical protein n=1 Tax=Staphylococcus marylandisciuri TaxID=2981529 RepID=UPI0021D39FE4|nr:hypothetical protein [Staphylococcus marylandisciuri]
MNVSVDNPAFGTPLTGFPEHRIFMSLPLDSDELRYAYFITSPSHNTTLLHFDNIV